MGSTLDGGLGATAGTAALDPVGAKSPVVNPLRRSCGVDGTAAEALLGGREGCIETMPEGDGRADLATVRFGGGGGLRPVPLFGTSAGWEDILLFSRAFGTGRKLAALVPATDGARAT